MALARQSDAILKAKVSNPCFLELLWNYWLEEGMVVQTVNAVTQRFQDQPGAARRESPAIPKADPRRPLTSLLWGWIEDEPRRLTIPRRAYEYDHEYGLRLTNQAAPQPRSADGHSRFLAAFHSLLHLCAVFYNQDDETTTTADTPAISGALRDVHMALTQGAHNQYGDLPWTARREFLMMQWILARPEMREFLPGPASGDYPEPWMDRVESVKAAEGWTGTSILHFRDLGVLGEKILLAVRYGPWANVVERGRAANWARYWRAEIQGYVRAYQAATGVDFGER
jgi:hypothetical protein